MGSEGSSCQHLVEAIAQRVRSYGLETPVLLFLEIHRPLAGLLTTGYTSLQPLVVAFLAPEQRQAVERVIGSREEFVVFVDLLITALSKGHSPGSN